MKCEVIAQCVLCKSGDNKLNLYAATWVNLSYAVCREKKYTRPDNVLSMNKTQK